LKLGRVVLGIAAAFAISASSLHAQRFGVQLNWADDADLGVGARLEVGLPNVFTTTGALSRTYLIGSFDYFFDCNNCTYWELNGNLAVPIAATGVDPYVGAGLNIAHISFDSDIPFDSHTDLGINLLGGLRFPIGTLSAFGEGRLEVDGGEQFVLTFGILLGGR
jgi:hypothetical protein